jgi:hypothetical protein
MKSITTISSSLVIASTLALGGCQQSEEEEVPPELPRVSSMSMDLDALTSAPAIAKSGARAAIGDYANFGNAYTRVAIVEVAAIALVALPATAIGLALTAPAEHVGDGRFHWSVTALGATADVFVQHSLPDGWKGELYISSAGLNLNNFLWVEGDFNSILTDGTWTLHDPNLPAANDTSLEIDWKYRADDDLSLTYRNVNQQSEDVGDTMDFSVLGDNASLVYTDASNPAQVATIIWDVFTAEGGMQVPDYNEGQEACWDAAFVNSSCK